MTLRPLEPEDLDLLFRIENSPALWTTNGGNHPVSRYALKQYIASALDIYECGEMRMVIMSDTGTAAGVIDLTHFSPLHAKAEISLALLEEYRGAGLAQKALKSLETWAIDNLRIHTLYAQILPSNTASLRLFTKSGYKETALLPDWHYSNGQYTAVWLYTKTF